MRMVGAQGRGSPVKAENAISLAQEGETLTRLLGGLDRMRPELGPLADELIYLLGGDGALAADMQAGAQNT